MSKQTPLITGTWFDSFRYEGYDPDSEVYSGDCNGTVYSNQELEDILSNMQDFIMNVRDEKTRQFLGEIMMKARFGIEANE